MRNERISWASARRVDMAIAPAWSRLEKLLLAAICAATLFFACMTPPFQAPDENQHYMKALQLAGGSMLAETRGTMIGAPLPRAAVEIHDRDFPTEPTGKRQLYDSTMLAKSAQADAKRPGTVFADFPNVANYAPTLYAPGAAGLMLGEAFGLPHIEAFYVGRIINAIAGLALLAGALSLLPFGRNAMLATALLPTFAYQTGSLSPDAVINGLAFLGLALTLRMGFMGSSRPAALFVTAPLLALCKGVYLPLLAAGLRMPDGVRDRRPWLILGAMATGAVVFALWMKVSGGTQALYWVTSRVTNEHVLTAPIAQQLGVVLRDPLGFVLILIESVTERMPVYALQIVGRFGWNAILLPLVAYPLAAVMILSAVLTGSGARFGFVQRLWWLAVAAGVAILIETAMYLTGTPPAADYIQGTQGRYFLPVLPLALLALSPGHALGRLPGKLLAGTAIVLLMIAAATAYDSFWVHGFVTDDGMPAHDDLASELFLPSPRW